MIKMKGGKQGKMAVKNKKTRDKKTIKKRINMRKE